MESPRHIRYADVVAKLQFSSAALSAILAHEASEPSLEVCGLLLGTADRIDHAQRADNIAAEPWHRFEIEPAALFAAIRAERGGGKRLVGYYHSHPGGQPRPSATDQATAAGDGKIWLIVAGGRVGAWRSGPAGFEAATIVTDSRSDQPILPSFSPSS